MKTRFHLKHRRLPLRKVALLGDKKLRRKLVIPHIFSRNFRGTRNFLKHRKVYLQIFCALRQRIIPTENLVSPLLHKTEINGKIHVYRTPMKTGFKTAVSPLAVCKTWSKLLNLNEKYASPSRPSCLAILFRSCNQI